MRSALLFVSAKIVSARSGVFVNRFETVFGSIRSAHGGLIAEAIH
jgi:hypothetical protein